MKSLRLIAHYIGLAMSSIGMFGVMLFGSALDSDDYILFLKLVVISFVIMATGLALTAKTERRKHGRRHY